MDALRFDVGQGAYELNVQQFCCAGLNFGYFYAGSPIIAHESEAPPAYSMGGFTPSTVPGCRAPHFWLADGRSLYDAFGPGYTLLRFDAGADVKADVSALVAAAQVRNMPLAVLDVQATHIPKACLHKLVLCRADQHAVWRGDQLPRELARLVALLCGAVRCCTAHGALIH